MTPVSPVVPGARLPEVTYAKNQPAYQPLPAWRDPDGTILTRWKLTWRERLRVLFSGDVYVWVLTFNLPLQPMKLEVERPRVR